MKPPRLGWWLPLAVAAAMVLAVVAEVGYRNATAYVTSLAERSVARTAINTVLRRLLDAETAQRGYLLTARPDYLEPGRQAASDIAASLAALDLHYAADARLKTHAAALRVKVDEKLSEIETLLTLHQQGQHQRWKDLLLTDIGRERMDAVRVSAEALLAAEEARVAVERRGVTQTLLWSRIGLHTLTVVCLAALAVYLRKAAAMQAVRARHARDLQAERDELERQVQLRTAELTDLAAHLQTVREDERGRLARELHDELGALLTAAKFDAARLKRALATPGPLAPEHEERLRQLNRSLDQGISLKRRIIEDLRPSALGHLGLKTALEIQAREFAERSGLPVQADIADFQLPDTAQITAYRVVQESFTNIAKHAQAHAVRLRLTQEGGHALLEVHDDGRGFDATAQRPRGSHGLAGMRYRVESLGGRWHLRSAPGAGTTVTVRLPLNPAAASSTSA